MGVEPGQAAAFGLGGQLVYAQQAFQSLEGELDLPAQAIEGEDFVSGVNLVERGGQDDKLGGDETSRIELSFVLGGHAAQPLDLGFDMFRGLAADDETRAQRLVAAGDVNGNVVDLAV